MKSTYVDRIRPRKRAYLVAPLALLILAVLVYYGSLWMLIETWDMYYPQIVFPGSHEFDFSEPGTYIVLYEFETLVGDVPYRTPENLAEFSLQIIAQTGEQIPVHREEGAVLEFGDYKVKPVARIFIVNPGHYRVTAIASPAFSARKFVLSLGEEIPFLYWILAAMHSIVAGLLAIAGVISPIIVWRNRKGSREFLKREAAKRTNW